MRSPCQPLALADRRRTGASLSGPVKFREHIEVDKALYSIPGALIGQRVQVRSDSRLVRVSHRGQLIKVHPRTTPGGRITDAEDLPAEREVSLTLRDRSG